jgi:hypothetical protein
LKSDWYHARLAAQQKKDIHLWTHHVTYLEDALKSFPAAEFPKLAIDKRLAHARQQLTEVQSPAYLAGLVGTLGLDPASI